MPGLPALRYGRKASFSGMAAKQASPFLGRITKTPARDAGANLYTFAQRLSIFSYFNLNSLARLIFGTRLKKAVDNKTIVLYKRLNLEKDNAPWIIVEK